MTDDWDDGRLNAAFATRARVTPSTPADLSNAVLAALEAPRTATWRPSRPWLAAASAAAMVLVVVAAGTRLLTIGDGRPAGSSNSAASGSAEGSSSPAATLATPALAAAPLSVADALAVRATGGRQELAVTGWLSPLPRLPCPFVPAGANPTWIHCPESFQWLMQEQESLMAVGPASADGGPPKGPAFHPSFALVDPPEVPIPSQGAVQPIPVVLIGHFHDRRASLCDADPAPETPCGDVFIVDEVAAIDGQPRGVMTHLRNQRFDDATQREVTEQPTDLQEDVDRIVLDAAPGATILSRQLVTIDQVLGIEPALSKDEFVPYVGNPATLMWIVTVLDPRDDDPIARTFALFDGSNWFAEVTDAGAKMLERRAVPATEGSQRPAVPSADPTAFDAAPTSVLGIKVRDIATVMRDRQATMDDLGRDELAIRAWYVGPSPAAGCEPAATGIHPPTPPCDEARHWLLDRPEQLGAEIGQLRTNPEHWPPVLNPLLPVDVPFDVPATWAGVDPVPQAVIVLGHFEDNRVDTYAGNVYFVLDALAWTRDRPVGTLDALTRLTSAATEDPASVLARVGDVSPNDSIATWTTVVDAADFASMEPRTAADAPEFTSGPPAWIVRRLIRNEMDGRQRLAVEWAYTADHGERVWWTETPDSSPDLGTTLDIHNIDSRTTLVRVFDYDQQIVSVRDVTPRDQLNWRFTKHKYMAILEVARGRTDREVAIRWTSGACDPEWLVRVNTLVDGSGVFIQPQTFGDLCPGDPVPRSILLVFDHPIALDAIRTTDEASSGGG